MRVRGDVSEGCIGLDMVLEGTSHDWVKPDVVGHADGVESSRFGGLDDLAEQRTEPRRASLPRRLRNVKSELHKPGLKTMSQTATRRTTRTAA